LFKLNDEKSCFSHNHVACSSLKSKHLSAEIQLYLLEESKKKNLKPKELKQKLDSKFNTNFKYRTIANAHYLSSSRLFGNLTDDAESMRNLILSLKTKFPNFLGEILKDNTNNQLKAFIYATSQMKVLAERFMDLFVMDTKFGTNRFRLKHWTMCGKDENNKTIIKGRKKKWLNILIKDVKLEKIRTSDELLEELDRLIEENEKSDRRQKEDVKNVVKENSEENLLENDGEFGDEEDLL